MAIGRISGPMLFNNLERQGVDLAFQSNLLYLDVNNLRVGVQNASPNYVLDTPGNVKLANIIIQGSSLSSNTGVIDFGSTANITISGGSANYVLYTDGAGNLNWGEISSLDSSWNSLNVSSFSTGNAVITGGYISGLSNITVTTGNADSWYANTSQVVDFSTGNAVITGGYFDNIANLTTAGTIISNGNIVANSGVNASNFTTGAIVVPNGGGVGITGALYVQGQSSFEGNINAGNIQLSGNINVPVGGTFSNTGVFYGNAGGIGALYAGTTVYTGLPHTVLQMTGNLNTYVQVNFQNYNSGSSASTDFVLTADNGNDTDGFINLGINSSTFADPAFPGFYPNDGYLVHHTAIPSGNLVILSHDPGSAIKLHVGDYGDANVRATVTNSGLRVNTATESTSVTTGALIVDGGLGIAGNIHAAAINSTPIGNTTPSTGSFTDLLSVTMVATNFSTGNAVITGGYVNNLSNLTATTAEFTNLSTGNAVISGGYISSLTNATITTTNITTEYAQNFSTGNAVITGGVLSDLNLQANNFSTANALVTGGNVTANISGNITATFGDFAGNVNANWFVGNVESAKANFSDLVFANSNLTVSGNLVASGNVITQKVTSPSGSLHISAGTENPNNVVIFDSVSAFLIPTGDATQRPGSPDTGYVRFNTDIGSIEWWTGLSWTSSNQGVNYQTIVPDGVSNAYTLDYESSDAGILVSINGTTQQPGTSYAISGGTTITFSEVPLTTDIIEIRFLSAGLVAASYAGGSVTGNVNILSNAESSSTTTGALTVVGGAGIAGNINVGGNIGISSTSGTPSNTGSPASWLKVYVGGSVYYLPLYQ
jgi:hypothetical protein